jgi:hypothetical protein
VAAPAADLHSLGVVHGRIDPTHVVLGLDGRPLLCGLSGASIAGRCGPSTSPPAAGFVDPRLRPGEPAPPAADVFAIGALLEFLLDRGGGRLRPPAGRRRTLHALARRAMAPESHRRPSAGELAAALERACRRRTPVPRAVLAVVTGGAALAAVVLTLVSLHDPGAGPHRPANRPMKAMAGLGPRPPSPSGSAAPAPQVVGPNVVAMGDDRFRAGEPGDQLLVGDWDCDGTPTVGLLRPASGEVFLFDAWATPGQDLREAPAAVVPGSVRAIAVDPEGDGCHRVLVERTAGEPVEVSP